MQSLADRLLAEAATNDVQKFRNAAIAHFTKGGWTGRDKGMRALKAAKTPADLNDALYLFAEAVGQRKGYGSEGVGSVHQEFLEDVAKQAGTGVPEDSEAGWEPLETEEDRRAVADAASRVTLEKYNHVVQKMQQGYDLWTALWSADLDVKALKADYEAEAAKLLNAKYLAKLKAMIS